MASTWYRDLGIGSYGSKMRVRVDALRQSLSGNYTRVRVRIYAYNGSTYSKTYNLGSGAAVAVSGDVSHSDRQTFSIGPGAWGTLADWEFSVGHDADGEKRFSITGRLSDTGTSALGNGGSITVTGTFDPLYLAPTSPTWGSTDYQDPDRVRVSWNRRASARGAYSRIRVQRWARSTGKWYHRAVLSGSATSYTDTSLSSNNEHRWRVRAEGPGGNSSWVQGGTLGTTPAAATNVRASKAEQGIDVSWTDNAARTNRSRTFYIDDNPGGNGWERVGSIGGSATSWAHADADPAVTHQYRVWTRINSQIDLTSSASDPSNTVQLQAAPDQPWREAPLDGTVQTVGVPFTLEWRHRPVDTTAQTEAEVQWRLDGGTWTTEIVTGSEQALEVNPTLPGARAQFEWRVRTRGAHPDWSPWSTINGPRVSTPPVIAIQAPTNGEALTTSRVTASWTYEPGGDEAQLAQAEWKVSLFLWDSGTLIEQRSGTTAEQVALGTRLENGLEYVLTVAVRNGDGLWSDGESARFSTDFPVPAEVTVKPRWDRETAAVSLGFAEDEALRGLYRWTGSPQESPSEMYAEDGTILATNDVQNPLGPGAVGVAHWTTTDPTTLEEVDGEPAALTLSDGANISMYADPEERPSPPVGTVVRFSVDVMVTAPTDGFRLTVSSYGGASTSNSSTGTISLAPEDGWVRLSIESTVEAMPDGGYIRTIIWPLNGSFDTGEGFYWRRALRTYDGPGGLPFFDGDTQGVTDVDAVDVERREPDGTWTLIASAIDTSSTITDRTPHIGDVEYRAISRTTLPTETEGPAATAAWIHDRDPVWVNGGDGMGQQCLARGAEATDAHAVDQALHRFAGQERPVAFFGTGQERKTSFTGKILPHYPWPVSSRDEWVALLRERGLVCFRDCTGRKVYGVLSVSFTQTGNVQTVSLEVEEAQYVEGVPRVSDLELEARMREEA